MISLIRDLMIYGTGLSLFYWLFCFALSHGGV